MEAFRTSAGVDGARVAAGADGGAGGVWRHGDVRAHEQAQLHAGVFKVSVLKKQVRATPCTCAQPDIAHTRQMLLACNDLAVVPFMTDRSISRPLSLTLRCTAWVQVQDWVPGEPLLKSVRPFRPETILQTAADLGRWAANTTCSAQSVRLAR
jgi:hypothetical protein